jgi:hypothetical protein
MIPFEFVDYFQSKEPFIMTLLLQSALSVRAARTIKAREERNQID